MKLDSLRHVGLTAGEIAVFDALLTTGPQPVSDLILRTNLKKGDCYNKLADLMQKGLIEEFEKDKKKHYRTANPEKLADLAQSRYTEAEMAKREMESVLPHIISTYTLTYQKPGISVFEGREAMKLVLDDSLTAANDIFQYVDLETVLGLYPKLNAAYARKRKERAVKKRILLSDNPLSRRYAAAQDPAITEVRLVGHQLPRFYSVMQIYNDKVSYLTLKQEQMIGVIIEDSYLAKMHRALFELTWDQAQTPPEQAAILSDSSGQNGSSPPLPSRH